MKVPQYLTQIDRATFIELMRAANIQRGEGITIEQKGEHLEIGIDKDWFKQSVWAFLRNGGQSSTYANLTNISLDPSP